MGVYNLFEIMFVLGVLKVKCAKYEGFTKYVTNGMRPEKGRIFNTRVMESIRCAVYCSILEDCDYYMYNTDGHVCKHHRYGKKIHQPVVNQLVTVHWKAHCGKPPRTSHGHVNVTDGVAHYTCNEYFKLFGTNDIRCFRHWPAGPKCSRYHWRNPIQRGTVFHAKIPWGFKVNGSVSLTGTPKQKECSFTVIMGVKKSSKSESEDAIFLLHLEVKVSEKTPQEVILHTGSLKEKKQVWKPKSPLYSYQKTTVLEVRINKNEFQIVIDKEFFPEQTLLPSAVKYEDIKVISVFGPYKIETVMVETP